MPAACLQDQGITYHDDCVEFWAWIGRGEHDNNYIQFYLQNSLVNQDNIKKIHVEYDLYKGANTSSSAQRLCRYTIPSASSRYYSNDSTMGKGYVNNIFGDIWMNVTTADLNFNCKVYRIWFE